MVEPEREVDMELERDSNEVEISLMLSSPSPMNLSLDDSLFNLDSFSLDAWSAGIADGNASSSTQPMDLSVDNPSLKLDSFSPRNSPFPSRVSPSPEPQLISSDGNAGSSTFPPVPLTNRKMSKRKITQEDLQHFPGSRMDAANVFGVSESTIKRLCREFGIPNWRYRNRDKDNQSLSKPKYIIQMAGGSISAKPTEMIIPGEAEDWKEGEGYNPPTKKAKVPAASRSKVLTLPSAKPVVPKKSTSKGPKRSLRLADEKDEITPLSAATSGARSATVLVGTSRRIKRSPLSFVQQPEPSCQEIAYQHSPAIPTHLPASLQLSQAVTPQVVFPLVITTTPSIQVPSSIVAQISRLETEEEDPEAVMDMFFKELSSELPDPGSPTISAFTSSTSAAQPLGPSRQQVKDALQHVQEYLSAIPAGPSDSETLMTALNVLTSLDESSGITVDQKSDLLDMALRLKTLPSEYAAAAKARHDYVQHETAKARVSKQLQEDAQAFETYKAEKDNFNSLIADLKAKLRDLNIKLNETVSANEKVKAQIHIIYERAVKGKVEKANLGKQTESLLKTAKEAELQEKSLKEETERMEDLISRLNNIFI